MTKYSEKIKASRRAHVNPTGYVLHNPNPPEINKWLANDFIEQISIDFEKNYRDILKKYSDLEPLTESLLRVYTFILNNGLEGVTKDTPVEQRRIIYNKKLGVKFWYRCFQYIKEELSGEKQRMYERLADDETNFDKEDRSAHKLNFIINEVDTKANYDSAMIEAILKWLEENLYYKMQFRYASAVIVNKNTKKPVQTKNKKSTYAKKQYIAYVIDAFKRYFIDGETATNIAKDYGIATNIVSMRNKNTIELIKENISEIKRLADSIYDEKYEFIL